MSPRRHVSAAGFIVALVFGALASPAAGEWKRLDSPNFVVAGEASAGDLKTLARKLEAFRDTLSRVLTPGATAPAVPTIVLVFPSDGAFTPFKPRHGGKTLEISGLFMPRQDASYIAINRGLSEHAMRLVLHDYAHQLIANASGVVPLWLTEGLAEFYSTLEVAPDGREALVGKAVPNHLLRLSEQRLLPLGELLTVRHDSPLYNEGDRRSTFYAQAWALTHMMLVGQPPRMARLSTYLERLGAGVPASDAWQQAFGGDPIERELKAYADGNAFKSYRVKLPEASTALDQVPAAPIASGDVEGLLATFLAQQQRGDEARDRLDRLPAAGADAPWIALARAMLEPPQAEAAAKRLTSLDAAGDWLLAYFAGSALAEALETRRRADPAEREAVQRFFQMAVKDGREIPNVLARTLTLELLNQQRPSDQTMLAFQRALRLAPGRDDYLILYARAMAQRESYPPAIALMRRLTASAYPAHVREAAQRAIEDFERAQTIETERASRELAPAAPDREPETAPRPASEPMYRKTEEGEQRFEGTLQRIDCASRAVTFTVATADGPALARAASMERVEFISYRDDLPGSVSCGAQKDPLPVYLTWRPAPDGKGDRIAVAIEFLPKPL